MVQSMTGFAVQTRDLGSVSLHLELRSVNSRYLDLGFRIVDDLRAAEPAIRAPQSWITMVRETVALDDADRRRSFGESLPPGLKLI